MRSGSSARRSVEGVAAPGVVPDVGAVAAVRPAGRLARSLRRRPRSAMFVNGSHSMPDQQAVLGGAVAEAGEAVDRLVERALVRADRLEVPHAERVGHLERERLDPAAGARTRRPRWPTSRWRPRRRRSRRRGGRARPRCRRCCDPPRRGGVRTRGRTARCRRTRRRGRGGDPLVELAEARPAEVRPHQVGPGELACGPDRAGGGRAHVRPGRAGCGGGRPSGRRPSRTAGGRPRRCRPRRSGRRR